jgi:ADP-ribosyl-[dinitrogen reductase] hydrolase
MKDKILLGAVAGDVIGSAYEFNPVKRTDIPLFVDKAGHRIKSSFTDDTVMTVAIADWLINERFSC